MITKQDIIRWCKTQRDQALENQEYFQAVIDTLEGKSFENRYHCPVCNVYFDSLCRKVHDADGGFDVYFVTCPHCGRTIEVGNDCYWR